VYRPSADAGVVPAATADARARVTTEVRRMRRMFT
jgi:hypothetical protein